MKISLTACITESTDKKIGDKMENMIGLVLAVECNRPSTKLPLNDTQY